MPRDKGDAMKWDGIKLTKVRLPKSPSKRKRVISKSKREIQKWKDQLAYVKRYKVEFVIPVMLTKSDASMVREFVGQVLLFHKIDFKNLRLTALSGQRGNEGMMWVYLSAVSSFVSLFGMAFAVWENEAFPAVLMLIMFLIMSWAFKLNLDTYVREKKGA